VPLEGRVRTQLANNELPPIEKKSLGKWMVSWLFTIFQTTLAVELIGVVSGLIGVAELIAAVERERCRDCRRRVGRRWGAVVAERDVAVAERAVAVAERAVVVQITIAVLVGIKLQFLVVLLGFAAARIIGLGTAFTNLS
jgi:hypothetical protein